MGGKVGRQCYRLDMVDAPNCSVIRCMSPAETGVRLDERSGDPREWAVCIPHRDELDAGGNFSLDGRTIHMGDDAWPVVNRVTMRDNDARHYALTFEFERGGVTEAVSLQIPDRLLRLVGMWASSRAPQ